ncbi:MAG TPA: hypothetical protein VME23_17350 [Terracidiphilus sp.]|nr:hypothetical protein [Terracidiphilus sp.]
MIRQAISCDICGSEKRQTNHWFVAYEFGGELRLSGWSSRHRLRPGSKHLCGQTCLHKLVDEFMAKSIAVRAQHRDEEEPALPMATDTSLTSKAAYDDMESSARLLTPVEADVVRPAQRQTSGLVTMPARNDAAATDIVPDEPRYNSAAWRAEAWERERERELRAAERRPDIVRRRSQQ